MSSNGKLCIKGAITAAVKLPPSPPFRAFISQDLPLQELCITPLNFLIFSPLPATQLYLKIFFQPDSRPKS